MSMETYERFRMLQERVRKDAGMPGTIEEAAIYIDWLRRIIDSMLTFLMVKELDARD